MTEFRTGEEIGEFLRGLREERGLTQGDIAEALDLDKTAISKIERGARSLTAKELITLADYYTIPSDAIVCREPEAVFLRGGDAEPEGVKRSLEIFRACIEDYLGLEALLA
jgi:transcriptional regulator with XRE-family HTH domain